MQATSNRRISTALVGASVLALFAFGALALLVEPSDSGDSAPSAGDSIPNLRQLQWAERSLVDLAARRDLTDVDLLHFATKPFPKDVFALEPIELGYYHGVRVLAQHQCAHMCADKAVLLIALDSPASACAIAKGTLIKLPFQGAAEHCVPDTLKQLYVQPNAT